ncbi:MAG: hypothetical protein L0323_20615 [Planctomycetes bacterium]|nr:hypothetical protein [Planctomycetota bacterium]
MTLPAMLACLLFQQTWVVDDNGGPGVNFTDIPPAIAAAADGDILIVRAGTYSPFALVGKGLRILGEGPGATVVQSPPGATVTSSVASLPATSPAWIEGMKFVTPPFITPVQHRLLVSGFSTKLTLSDVVVEASFGAQGANAGAAVDVVGAEVQMLHCTVTGMPGTACGGCGVPCASAGGPGLRASSGARVHVAWSTIRGGPGGLTAGSMNTATDGGPGVVAESGPALTWVWLANSTVVGGAAGYTFTGFGGIDAAKGGSGIVASSSRVRVSGTPGPLSGGGAVVSGGAGGDPTPSPCFPGGPGVGIETSGTAVVDVHSVPVLSGAGFPPGTATSGPGITLNLPPLSVLDLAGSLFLSGGSATLTISDGPPDALFGVVIGLGPDHFGIPGPFLGEFLIGPLPFTLFLLGTLSPAGAFSVTYPLGTLPPSLAYSPFHFQAATFEASSGTWRLSNAAVAILRP